MSARTTALCVLIAVRRQGAWSDGILKEYVQRDPGSSGATRRWQLRLPTA